MRRCTGLTRRPLADDRNLKIECMLYAGNNLDKARELFADAIKHRPRIRLTIRQRTRVLFQWPLTVTLIPLSRGA